MATKPPIKGLEGNNKYDIISFRYILGAPDTIS